MLTPDEHRMRCKGLFEALQRANNDLEEREIRKIMVNAMMEAISSVTGESVDHLAETHTYTELAQRFVMLFGPLGD